MSRVPFAVLLAAQAGDIQAAELICRHYDSYIDARCRTIREDGDGRPWADPDLRYLAERALLTAIFKFCPQRPPEVK